MNSEGSSDTAFSADITSLQFFHYGNKLHFKKYIGIQNIK